MTDQTNAPPKKLLSRPVEVVRQDLLNDPETREIAKTLGISIEEYVEKVLDYAQNPDKEPQVVMIDEEEAEEEGLNIPSMLDVQKWFNDVESGKVALGPKKLHLSDEIVTERPEADAAKATGAAAELAAPDVKAPKSQIVVEDNEIGSILRQQLQNQKRNAALGSNLPQPGKKPKR